LGHEAQGVACSATVATVGDRHPECYARSWPRGRSDRLSASHHQDRNRRAARWRAFELAARGSSRRVSRRCAYSTPPWIRWSVIVVGSCRGPRTVPTPRAGCGGLPT
jgi:hypothetical protein